MTADHFLRAAHLKIFGAAETAERYLVLGHTMRSIERENFDNVLVQLLNPEMIWNSSPRSINHETT
jgi:hypothetical protein